MFIAFVIGSMTLVACGMAFVPLLKSPGPTPLEEWEMLEGEWDEHEVLPFNGDLVFYDEADDISNETLDRLYESNLDAGYKVGEPHD